MREALGNFLTQVQSIERTIELREGLVEVGRIPPRHLHPTAAELRRKVRQVGLSGMQPSLDGSVLLTAAALEQFVSDLVVAFVAELPARIPVYGDLPNAIRSANERLTGEALNRSRARFTDYDLRQFVINLRDCQAGVVPYVLNGEAIALNDRNLKPGQLRDLISRLAVGDIWKSVASTRTLQRWSGPGGAKTTESRAKTQLSELIDNRNNIAHGVGRTTLGPQTILSFMRFARVLARSLVTALEKTDY